MVSPGERLRSLEEEWKWTLVAAGAFGVAGAVSAIAVWLFIGVLGEIPALTALRETVAYVVSLALVSTVLGAVLGGTFWYLVFERVCATSLERHSAWGYPVSGGLVGLLNGVFVHIATVWITLLVIEVGSSFQSGAPPFSRASVYAFLFVPFFSLLLFGWVSVPPYMFAGACLGAGRHLAPFATGSESTPRNRKADRG
ncbi:hypothetical protein BRD00_03965 [Halobacteriales archaeon QS_8_69_26]|nr:MAG: hypothetical protein BRD00_03965 [Halobacteriales archaeon QS_8_69_26]